MKGLDSTAIDLLLKVTLILVAGLALYFATRRVSAANRNLGLRFVTASLLLLPLLVMALPAWELQVLPAEAAVEHSAASSPAVKSLPYTTEGWRPMPNVPLAGAAGSLELAAVPQSAASLFERVNPWALLLACWMLGTLVVAGRLLYGMFTMHRIAGDAESWDHPVAARSIDDTVERLGLRRRPALRLSQKVDVPLVWGLWNPVMILPTCARQWSEERLQSVFLHEASHLKRADWPWLIASRLVASIYWFHPLVWFTERLARRECERACDDLVVDCGTRPSDYASHLLAIAQGVTREPRGLRAALAVVGRSPLEDRLRSILDPAQRRGSISRRAAAIVGSLLLIGLAPIATVQLAQAQQSEKSEQNSFTYKVRGAGHNPDHDHHEELSLDEADGVSEVFDIGFKLHARGQYDEAREAFELAIDSEFRPSISMYNIACGFAKQGDVNSTIAWLERAMEAGWDSPQDFTRDDDFGPLQSDPAFRDFIDEAYEQTGKRRGGKDHPFEEAVKKYNELLDDKSDNAQAWHQVGTRLLAMRDLDRATSALERAVSHGDEPDSHYNLACALALDGNNRQAIAELDQAIESGFSDAENMLNDPDLISLRGSKEFNTLIDKCEFLSLDRFGNKWVDHDRHDDDSDDSHDSNYSAERWSSAIDDYTSYVRQNPSSGRAWFNLGYAQHYSSRHEEAITSFERALDLGQRPSTSRYNLACANAMLGRTAPALKWLESAVEDGGVSRGQVEGDTDLDSLRDNSRYDAILDELKSTENRFDFKFGWRDDDSSDDSSDSSDDSSDSSSDD